MLTIPVAGYKEAVEMSDDILLARHLDEHRRLIRWPSKPRVRQAALRYLIAHFESGRDYNEREVNSLLNQWHVFHDPALLRRELFRNYLLNRTKDGRRYWLPKSDSLS